MSAELKPLTPKPLHWFHRVLIILAISAIPLFALVCSLTESDPDVAIVCENIKTGLPAVAGIGTVQIVQGYLHFENKEQYTRIQMNQIVCKFTPYVEKHEQPI